MPMSYEEFLADDPSPDTQSDPSEEERPPPSKRDAILWFLKKNPDQAFLHDEITDALAGFYDEPREYVHNVIGHKLAELVSTGDVLAKPKDRKGCGKGTYYALSYGNAPSTDD